MASDRTWTIKGVGDRTRDAVYEATRAEGLTVGEWVDRALAKAAEETLHPKPPAATRADVAEIVREQLAPVVARLEALETTGGPAPAGMRKRVARGRAPGRRRGLPEDVSARIEELHRTGRSAYAISKELGVSYNAVRARVKALEAAG